MPRDANLSGNIWKSTTPSRLRSLVSCLLWFFSSFFYSHTYTLIFFCGANLFLFLLVIHSLFTLCLSRNKRKSYEKREELEKRSRLTGAARGSPLIIKELLLSRCVCCFPSVHEELSAQRDHPPGFSFTRKDTLPLSPCLLFLFSFCEMFRTITMVEPNTVSLLCTHRHAAASHLYTTQCTHRETSTLFSTSFFFCLS